MSVTFCSFWTQSPEILRRGAWAGGCTGSLGWLGDFRAQIPPAVGASADGSENGWVGVQNFTFSGYLTVSGLCMHDFCARYSAPWKIFCFLLKFLLKKCYKCRVGSKKSESRGVGWLIEPRSLLGGACRSPHA